MILRGEFGLDFDQTQIWYDRSLEGRMLEDLTDLKDWIGLVVPI